MHREASTPDVNRSSSPIIRSGSSSPPASNLSNRRYASNKSLQLSYNTGLDSPPLTKNLSHEFDYLSKENKKLKDLIDEKSLVLASTDTEIKNLRLENFKLKTQIKNLDQRICDQSRDMLDSEDFDVSIAEERKKYYSLLEKYQLLIQDSRSQDSDSKRAKILEEENQKLIKQVEILKDNISEKNREIFQLNTELRRTQPQESIDFQGQLDKIKQVLSSRKEPTAEIKREIDELKLKCENSKQELKAKETIIESLKALVREKENEIESLKKSLDESMKALDRLSCQLIESKTKEAELEEAVKGQQIGVFGMDNESMQRLEIEMLQDMFRRLSSSCMKKCLFSNSIEASLTKGEDVCLKRCVSKYTEMHMKIGQHMNELEKEERKTRVSKDPIDQNPPN